MQSSMSITEASGRCLNIIGTAKMFISNTQVLGEKRKLVEGAVLEGNQTDREVLISLQLPKDCCLVHSTFPQETIQNFITQKNKSKKTYSALYSMESQLYEKQGTYTKLKEPAKACKHIRDQIIHKYEKIFVTKFCPQDIMNAPPIKLVID